MFELLANQAAQWMSVLRNFDGTYQSVADNVAALRKVVASSAFPYNTRAEAAALMKQGQEAQAKLQALKATRDKVVGWLKSVLPGSGSQLGVLPLVYVGAGLAAFAAALALANKFLTGSASFARQISAYQVEQQRLVDQGMDPAKAAALARQSTKALADSADRPGLFEKLGGKALWIGGGVLLAVWLGPRILDHLSARRGR
jgi:hypothetical protein